MLIEQNLLILWKIEVRKSWTSSCFTKSLDFVVSLLLKFLLDSCWGLGGWFANPRCLAACTNACTLLRWMRRMSMMSHGRLGGEKKIIVFVWPFLGICHPS